uniref:Si:ch211-283h6.4 n=1 Tax=Cyprinus carpio TaxID=7962 RepID=A0A8C1ILK3_CYPCA
MEVMCDAEGESVKYKPGGRLDMSHGFLRHIRRNQIARDDYDREVKQAKEKQRGRHTTTPRRPRRPDRQVYHPRLRNGSEPGVNAEAEDWNESSSGTEPENTGTELFWLDYQADSGQITSLIVHKEDKPEVIVERVAEKNALDSAMRAALLARVGQEMDKRCDKR